MTTRKGSSSIPLSARPFLSTREVASLLGVAPQTLRAWRSRGVGPRYFRLGPRAIRYRQEDIELFLRPGR